MTALRTHQRNLYLYFLKHEDGCKVPLHLSFGVKKAEHLNAVNALERKRLIKVNRASDNYLMWTVRLS